MKVLDQVSTRALDTPLAVEERLASIENQLAEKQNRLEDAAMLWFRLKKQKERARVDAWVECDGTVAERNVLADRAALGLVYATPQGPVDAWEAEGAWEALKASVRVLEARSAIGMSLLKSQRGVGS